MGIVRAVPLVHGYATMGPFSAFKRYTLETHGRDAVIVELKGTTKKGRVPHVPRAGARVKQVPSIPSVTVHASIAC